MCKNTDGFMFLKNTERKRNNKSIQEETFLK